MKGIDYNFEVSLNFTDNRYKPTFVRSTTATKQFSDAILPIETASAKNSWQIVPSKGAGLVVSFKETDQFYGSSNILYRPYNLEGNTKVKAQYRTFDTPTSQWSGWSPLSHGSISQSSITYQTTNNNEGVVLVLSVLSYCTQADSS